MAVSLVAVATILRWAMGRFLGITALFVTFYPAVVLVALICGLGPAVVAVVLSGLVADFLFFSPIYSFRIATHGDAIALLFFLISGVFLAIIAHRLNIVRTLNALRRYELLASNARDIVLFVRRRDGHILEANQAAMKAYGYSRDEILSLTIYNLRGQDNYLLTDSQMDKADSSGILFETNHRRKDGTTFPVEVSSRGVYIDGERVLLSVIRDITERKEAESKLRESEEMLARAQQMAHVGHWHRDISTGKGRWSDETYRIFGLTPQECEPTRQFFLECVHRDDRARVDKALRDAAEDVRPYDEIFRIVCPDGSVRWVQSKGEVTRNPEGKPSLVFGTILNITERKRMEEELRRSHDELEQRVADRTAELARLAAAMNSASEGIIITDSDWRIEYVNPAFTRLCGYESVEVIGRDMGFLRPEKMDHAVYDRVRGSAKSDKPNINRYPLRKKDGKNFQVESTITPIKDSAGNITSYVVVWRDISEKIELEERLRQSQKMEAIGTLAGGIAHDFNNMLAVIIGNAELVLDDINEDSPKHNIDQILKASKRSRDLVKQILTFTRKDEPLQKEQHLIPLIQESFDLLRASVPSTVKMTLNIRTKADTAKVNEAQFQQVLINLCTNAEYAMRETGGTLSISLEDETLHLDGPSGSEPHRYLKLAVSDTGTGIDEEVRKRIFDPFFTTKGLGVGTGMGLAVVYGIVQSHHGLISVQSEPGKGSTFSILFPEVRKKIVSNTEPEVTPVGGEERILFVDDEIAVVEMTTSILKRMGYEVIPFIDSQDALDAFANAPDDFDLVITDQTMPRITGVELSERMKAIRPDIPILLCTGYSHVVSAEQAKAQGIDGYVMKPLAKRELAEAIRKVLDQGGIC